jgi:hypothetical protein
VRFKQGYPMEQQRVAGECEQNSDKVQSARCANPCHGYNDSARQHPSENREHSRSYKIRLKSAEPCRQDCEMRRTQERMKPTIHQRLAEQHEVPGARCPEALVGIHERVLLKADEAHRDSRTQNGQRDQA